MTGFHVRRDDDEQTASTEQWLNVSQQRRRRWQMFDHIVHYDEIRTLLGKVGSHQGTADKRHAGIPLTRPGNPGFGNVDSSYLLPALAKELAAEPTVAATDVNHAGPRVGEFG